MTKSTKARILSSAGMAGVGLVIIGTILWHQSTEWAFRRELPKFATEVHESYWEDSLLPDYSYYLRAKISRQEFDRYVAHFNLTPHTPLRIYEQSPEPWLEWHPDQSEDGKVWWDPSDSLEDTYVAQMGDTWTFAKYERGFLYLCSLNH